MYDDNIIKWNYYVKLISITRDLNRQLRHNPRRPAKRWINSWKLSTETRQNKKREETQSAVYIQEEKEF